MSNAAAHSTDPRVMSDQDKQLIVRSWKLLEPISETATELFYGQLFRLDPSVRRLFPEDMTAQRRKLFASLAFMVKALDWASDQWNEMVAEENDLFLVVLALGRRHRNLYKVQDSQYALVGAALMWTLDQGLGEALTPEVKRAWEKLYGLVSTAMKLARE